MKKMIGRNLKAIRGYNGFTQEQVAQFLEIERSTYSNYESGDREAPLDILEKCADIYGCELIVFFNEDELSKSDILICTFKINDISKDDMKEISLFKSIVKNYIKINQIASR